VYHYKTVDAEIKAGDQVIVDSPFNGLTVVEVDSVVEYFEVTLGAFDYKWIVARVDLAAYERQKSAEVELKRELARLRMVQHTKQLADALALSVGEEGASTIKGLARL
jgi:hypothetical protein